MNLVWGKMGKENLTSEEPLPAGGIHDHPGGKTLLSAVSPKLPVTVSLVPQHSLLLLYSMQETSGPFGIRVASGHNYMTMPADTSRENS